MDDITKVYLEDFALRGKANVLIDGQYGSTGKGLIAACLGMGYTYDVATTNASANAGHTAILPDGKKIVTYHLPMAGLMNDKTIMYLNAGSIIDPDLLMKEIEGLDLEPITRLCIHPRATIITQEDKDYEKNPDSGTTKIASTQKGVGRALARRIMREGKVAKDCPALKEYIGTLDLNYRMSFGQKILVEIPQGLSLSNQGLFYPYCTSRAVSVGHSLADAVIHPKFLGNVMLSIRSYPIRVGNIPGGNSGDCYEDQIELSWEDLGIEPEITTVTKRIRRVFTFSGCQYNNALMEVQPTHIFGNFANYFKSYDKFEEWRGYMLNFERTSGLVFNHFWGVGPTTDDVFVQIEDVQRWFKLRDEKDKQNAL